MVLKTSCCPGIQFICMKFLLGCLSALMGSVLSPQFVLKDGLENQFQLLVVWCLVFGVAIHFLSSLNGCDSKMVGISRVDYLFNSLLATFAACGLSVVVIYLTRYELVGRWILLISSLLYFVVDYGCIWFVFRKNPEYTFAVGFSGDVILDICKDLRYAGVSNRLSVIELSVCGDLMKESVAEVVRSQSVFFVSPAGDSRLRDYFALNNLCHLYPNLITVSNFLENELELIWLESVSWVSWSEVSSKVRSSKSSNLKRVLDIFLVAIFFPAGCLLIAVAGLLIKMFDQGPVFYSQIRLGQFEIPFKIYKLRTMSVDSETDGPQWAKVGDSRVSVIGKILRKTRIDELPQLWNVFCGEMSFIGPRPERPEMYNIIESELPQFKLRLACKPGITGWAQVKYPYGASVRDAGFKLMFDLYYIKNYSLLLDAKILMRTFVAMVKGAR
jgi:lipopolysaccharide/colanic/teichoic acid biosynthesis glycosyltransferase